jgi:hypothetical protein
MTNKRRNHPSMRVMPIMPYLPRCTTEYVKEELTDEEIFYALDVWEKENNQKF